MGSKWFSKLGIALAGIAMAVGVGVGLGQKEFKEAKADSATIAYNSTFDEGKTGTQSTGSQVKLTGAIVIFDCDKGYVNTSSTCVHLYSGSNTTISVVSGYYITGITFTCTANNSNNNSAAKLSTSTTNATWTCTTGQKTGVWVPKAGQQFTSVEFSASAQSRMSQVEVSYAASSPTVKIDSTSTEINVSVRETQPIEKTLELTNVTMGQLTIASEDPDTATVAVDSENKKITITGVAHGTTDVTIKKSSDTLFTVHVTVTYNNTVTVTSAGSATSLDEGKTLQLSATSSKGDDTFTWESSNNSIATVSSSGLVTGVAIGQVTITATSVNWETSGTKILTINFAGSYSRGYWFNPSTYDSTGGTDATEENLLTAITASSSTIAGIDKSGTVAFDKGGGLAFGGSKDSGSLVFTMKSGFYLKSITIWGAFWDAGITPSISATNSSDESNAATLLSNAGTFVSKGTAINNLPLTWTFASDAKTVTIATPGASKQRFIIYQLDLVFKTITPTSVSLSETNATLMQTETKKIVAQIEPANYNVNVSVSWTSSNTDAATVNDGLIKASSINTGNSTITASTSYGNPTCAVSVIPLVASSVNIRGETANSLTGAASETLSLSGKTWEFTNVLKYTLDYKPLSEVLAMSKGALRIGNANNAGSVGNKDAYAFKIKKVIVAHCLNGAKTGAYEASYTIVGSDTYGGSDIAVEDTSSSGILTTYTLESAVSYVKISSTGGTYISSLTFVFETPSETEISAAEFILGLSPDRGEESIGACTIANGTYAAAKKFLYDAGDTVKANFQTSENATVVAARTRYTYWANNNHDISPYEGETPVLASRVVDNLFNSSSDANELLVAIIIIASVSALAIGGYFFIRRKHQ